MLKAAHEFAKLNQITKFFQMRILYLSLLFRAFFPCIDLVYVRVHTHGLQWGLFKGVLLIGNEKC